MSRWFLQHNTCFIASLGHCEDFEEACDKAEAYEAAAEGPSWILDEEALELLQKEIATALQADPDPDLIVEPILGGYIVSDIIGNHRIAHRYLYYTKGEAVALFKETYKAGAG